MADRYVVTRRAGVDTLHKNPGEQCNLDDTMADKVIDEFTAVDRLLRGDARPCKHCDLKGGTNGTPPAG
jgi:hypothetical protein